MKTCFAMILGLALHMNSAVALDFPPANSGCEFSKLKVAYVYGQDSEAVKIYVLKTSQGQRLSVIFISSEDYAGEKDFAVQSQFDLIQETGLTFNIKTGPSSNPTAFTCESHFNGQSIVPKDILKIEVQ